MTEIWANLQEVEHRIASMRRRFLFADFDGTLAPIVSVPGDAALAQDIKPVLRGLAAADVQVAIISGRALDDLQVRIGLPLIYAGNHGLEIRGAGLEYTNPQAKELRYELLALSNRLRAELRNCRGALVECKRMTASVHFRMVDRGAVPEIDGVVQAIVREHPSFRTSRGREVIEIRPDLPWNKGSAARWVVERMGGEAADTISIGDDVTDEDMFRELRDGITVRVGADLESCAEYRLEYFGVLPFLRLVRDAAVRSGDWVSYGGSSNQQCVSGHY